MVLIIVCISCVKNAWLTGTVAGPLMTRNRFFVKARINLYCLKLIFRTFCPAGADSIPGHAGSVLWLANAQGCIFLRILRLSPVSITPLVLHKHCIHLIPTPYIYIYIIFPPMAQRPVVGQGHLIVEALRSHSVGHLWTSDQPVAETSTWRHATHTRGTHPWPVRDSSPQA
jgi:hypothetical protein